MIGIVFSYLKRARAVGAAIVLSACLTACGMGGGGSSSPTLPPVGGGSGTGTGTTVPTPIPSGIPTSGGTSPITSSGNCTGTPSGLPVQGQPGANSGTFAWSVCDYFTYAIPAGVTSTIDGASVPLTGGSFTKALSSGMHQLVVTAPNYTVYHGAIDASKGAPLRQIQLFPMNAALQAWFTQVNADRTANGATAFPALDDVLTIAAFDHAADMETLNYFDHPDQKGLTPDVRQTALGVVWTADAENIAGNQTWQGAETDFMSEKSSLPTQSPSDCPAAIQNTTLFEKVGHYCNIVDPGLTSIGLGLAGTSSAGSNKCSGICYDQEFDAGTPSDPTTAAAAATLPNLYFTQSLEGTQ